MMDDLDGDQFFVQLDEKVNRILQEARKEYVRILSSAVYQRVYGKIGLKICLLPLTVSRCLFCHDGTLNLGLVHRLKEIFLPPKQQRDDIEIELANGLNRCIEDHTISSAIESLSIPISALGERIVKATLSLDVQAVVSSYHLRVVCCSSFLTWVRQFVERDCYVKALLSHIKQGSFQQFFDDFRHLVEDGAIIRSLRGRDASFIPLEELPSSALVSTFPCRDVRFLLKIPAVKQAFSIVHADENQIRMAVQKVKGPDQSCALKNVFQELSSDRKALCFARLYVEAPVQNIAHQVLENCIVSLFVHPASSALTTPEYGEKIEWVWNQVIDTFLEKTIAEPTADDIERCKAAVSEKLRLAFSPQKEEGGAYPLWRICFQSEGNLLPIESKKALGELLHGILKEGLVKRGKEELCIPLVLGVRFFSLLQRYIQLLASEQGSKVLLQEHPISFPSPGHHCEALVQRYFPNTEIALTSIPVEGEAFVRWAEECQNRYGTSFSLSCCAAAGPHAFRLFPFSPPGGNNRDVQAIVQPFVESSASLCKQPWSLFQESAVIQQLIEYWMSSVRFEDPCQGVKERTDRSVEGVLTEFSLLTSGGRRGKEKALLLMLSLLLPLERFPQFQVIEKTIGAIAKRQTKRAKLKGKRGDCPSSSSYNGSSLLVTMIEQASLDLVFPLPQNEIHQLASAIEKMVRDVLFQEGISGKGLLIRIGDSNYVTDVMGVVRRGEVFLWYNPVTKKWNQVVYFGEGGWEVSEQEKIRIIGLAPSLETGVKNQEALHEVRQKRKAEKTRQEGDKPGNAR
jgi:hypothetical protein